MSDAAIASIVTGIVTMTTIVVGFLTLWLKLRYGEGKTEALAKKAEVVENKIDNNTLLTKAAGTAAVQNAHNAAVAANETKEATQNIADTISKKLNGGLDHAIETVIKPIREALQEHVEHNNRNMNELRAALEDLKRRVR